MFTATRGAADGGVVGYRYLRLGMLAYNGTSIFIATVDWTLDGVDYPAATMTDFDAPSPLVCTWSVGSNGWKVYDNSQGGADYWTVSVANPASVTIDLGEGNELEPTGVTISMRLGETDVQFECRGSNDNFAADDNLLYTSASGITWAAYDYNAYTF